MDDRECFECGERMDDSYCDECDTHTRSLDSRYE